MWLETIRFLYAFLFFENVVILSVFFALIVLLTVAGILSYRFGSGSVFLAVSSLSLGVTTLIFTAYAIPFVDCLPFFALLAITIGAVYLIFYIVVSVSAWKKRVREERENSAREMRYTLPQKDNTFIRARLNAVSEEMVEKNDGEEIKLRFTYAKNLLEKLRMQTLTVTEKLEMDELASVLAVYSKKETYVGEDVRLISEAFARVLKLSAKYGV